MPLRLIKEMQQSGATIGGSHFEIVPGTNIESIVFDADTNVNVNQGEGQDNQQNKPAVCGVICQRKKRTKYAMVAGVVILGAVSAYFIFKKNK
jgi:hypothetical protein